VPQSPEETKCLISELPLDLLESDAWRSLSINARRFIDFLMIAHMRHEGQRNGELPAPRRQLEASGISASHVSAAINEAVRVGLIDRKRGAPGRPNTYALAWLALSDGSKPSNGWRTYKHEKKARTGS
jgi:DNA-binding transcriptional MocR family regulator